jgi:hypothetical protein
VHAFAFQRVQVDGQGRDKGFTLAGAHFGDVTFMQRHAAHHLNVEVTQAQRALRGLADGCESFGQDVIELFPGGQHTAEFFGLGRQRLFRHPGQGFLESADLFQPALVAFQHAIVMIAEY